MSTIEQNAPTVEQRIRELAAELRMHRQHPCLLFVSASIQGRDVLTVRTAIEEERGPHLDLIVSSPGGDIGAAYLVARELRRRFASLTVFVPFQAKSAATLLREEAHELGIPTRIPDAQESALLDQLALALIEYGTTSDLITLVGHPAAAIAAAQQVLDQIPERQQPADSPRVRRSREKGAATRRTHGKAAA